VTLFEQKVAAVRSRELAGNRARELAPGLYGPEFGAQYGPYDEHNVARLMSRLSPAAGGARTAAPVFSPAFRKSISEWREPAEEFSRSVRVTPDGLQVPIEGGGFREYRLDPKTGEWLFVHEVGFFGAAWSRVKERFAWEFEKHPRPDVVLADKQEIRVRESDPDGRWALGYRPDSTYRWNQDKKLWYAVRPPRL
jgi:hypothetical protein